MASVLSQTFNVTGTTFPAADAPDAECPFTPREILLINEDASQAVDVSLDGVTVAATLVPGTPSAGLKLDSGVTKIYTRASAGTPQVQVIFQA